MTGSDGARVLAVAARTGRICCVYLVGDELLDWQLSRKGAGSAEQASLIFAGWLALYRPEILISEDPKTATRKSMRQREILTTFARLAETADTLNIVVARQKKHQNIYVEASALAEAHPIIRAKRPAKPPIWMPEPRNTIYFEALAMAQQVQGGPQEHPR